VKTIEELTLPYTFTPERTIEGSVNGVGYYFQAGKLATPTHSEYSVIKMSEYKGEL